MVNFMKKSLRIILLLVVLMTTKAMSFNPQLSSMLQDTLNRYVSMITNIKGMSASVYLPGQGIWQGSTGLSYSEHPITSDMMFGIASNTKLFVATAILKLAENKILSLDDSLHKWIPNYPNINPDVTIRQLLNHTSGISDPLFVPPYMDTIMNNPKRVFTPNEVLGWMSTPLFSPGKGWGYSNINYIIAGMIVKNATGNHISKIIRDSILTPMHLDSMFYDVEEPERGNISHRWFNNIDYKDTSRIGLNTAGGCAGALFSTSNEMVKWYHALMSGQILNSASLAELTNFVSTKGQFTYGLGLEKQTFFGHTVWGHDGSTWGYKSRMIYDPCSGIVVCGLANSWPAGMDGITLILYKVLADYLPACPGIITGQTNLCQGEKSVTYTIPEITNATSYSWTLPNGATGTSQTNSITVDYDLVSVSGDITIKGVNSYGDGPASALKITIIPKPPTPIVTKNVNILHSDAPVGNQWYDSKGKISGATNQNYTVTTTGSYYTISTLSGCNSESSNIIFVNLSGVDEYGKNKLLSVYPNPVKNELTIDIEGLNKKIEFSIMNSLGEFIFKGEILNRRVINTDRKTSCRERVSSPV